MRKVKTISILIYLALLYISAGTVRAEQSVAMYLELFEKGSNQTVEVYQIDTLIIERGGAIFHLGMGKLVMLNFGWDKPSAMVYQGHGKFMYVPPNKVEYHQLYKFKEEPNLNHALESATFLFTVPLENLPANPLETRQINNDEWEQFYRVRDNALSHLYLYFPNKLLDDLVSEGEGRFFYADFDIDGIGNLAFVEDPFQDDWYRIYDIKRAHGILMADVLAGFSPDDRLPSQRGVMPIDIIRYDIESDIQADGDMTVKCRINYVPLISGRKYLYFDWFYENKIFDAFDSQGRALIPVYKKEIYNILDEEREESGIGLVLREPIVAGDTDYVDINYECECLRKHETLYYVRSETRWYPRPEIRDLATYTLDYICSDKYEILSSGNKIDEKVEAGKRFSRFEVDRPFEYVSFNVGTFNKKEMIAEGYIPVIMNLAEELADMSVATLDEIEDPENVEILSVGDTSHVFLASSDRIGQTGADMLNSLAFFTSMFGPTVFDTIKVASTPYSHGQGSPGLIHLSWSTFLDDDLDGWDESFRAHEMAHQWWGHVVGDEVYRDVWIIEGLAEYCGLWFYEMSAQDKGEYEKMMRDMRQEIIYGRGPSNAEKGGGFQIMPAGTGQKSVGSKAGPISLGYRLSSSISDDYNELIYYKGAYIFHMIRYLLHDYKTGSDDKFAFFLRDLATKFANKPITTEGLKDLLEMHVGGDMSWFFDQWVHGMEIPRYEFSYSSKRTKDKKYNLTCSVDQKDVPADFKMIVPITVLFKDDRFIHFRIWVTKPSEKIALPVLPYKPEKVIFNTYDAVLCEVKYK